MDKTMLECKVYEFLGRLSIALKKGDMEAERKYLRQVIIMQAERSLRKAKEAGILFPLGEKQIELLNDQVSEARKMLVGYGKALCVLLDLWQERGATLQDLCNLCNRDYSKVLEEINPERLNESFSGLLFVYNLDYKDPRNRGWIDFDVDAPLTHAVKEHWLDLMLHTPEGREASSRAMEEVFPELMENAMTLVTDADGVKHLIDKDGVEVGVVGEEE